MATLTEAFHTAEFLVSEANGSRSRESVIIAASQTLAAGAVLAQVAVGAVTVTPDEGNTGDGVVTATAGAGTPVGTYAIAFTAAATNGGSFRVTAPDGDQHDGVVGTALVVDGLTITIPDGDADWIVTDTISIAVASGSGQYVAYDPTATNGAETAVAVLYGAVTTGAAETAEVAAIVRDAEVAGDLLQFASGVTANQQAAAKTQLAAVGIHAR